MAIVVKLKGGLGNQMFQYAIGRALAIKNKDSLFLDLTFLLNKNLSSRNYGLDVFDIKANPTFLSKVSLRTSSFNPLINKKSRSLNKIKNIIDLQQNINETQDIEGSFKSKREFLNQKGNLYLNGYWQNERYFKDIEHTIREDFSFENKPSKINKEFLKKISKTNSISLHIRRGDYAKNSKTLATHGLLGLDYYFNAINIMKEKLPNFELFVFSDDIDWAKKNLNIDTSVNFIDHNKKDYEDLRLMINCKHHIIANSSFSWWGAWLSKNNNKIVIAPDNWFTKKGLEGRKNFNIVPDNWIKK